jgi:hypothetical protein
MELYASVHLQALWGLRWEFHWHKIVKEASEEYKKRYSKNI